jgi:hypothetical protein
VTLSVEVGFLDPLHGGLLLKCFVRIHFALFRFVGPEISPTVEHKINPNGEPSQEPNAISLHKNEMRLRLAIASHFEVCFNCFRKGKE